MLELPLIDIPAILDFGNLGFALHDGMVVLHYRKEPYAVCII
jgi:hypothetical protein